MDDRFLLSRVYTFYKLRTFTVFNHSSLNLMVINQLKQFFIVLLFKIDIHCEILLNHMLLIGWGSTEVNHLILQEK